jgi:glutamate N-acetyltransferase / amino-acid N-acetyltransferase
LNESKNPFDNVPDNVRMPAGFRFTGIKCGIKASGKPDLSLVVCDQPVSAAAVTTRNKVVAAPVILCRERTPSATIRGVVTVSGNANACTGERGAQDAAAMAQQVAEKIGCNPTDVLVMSTGVIGKFLPMPKVQAGIHQAFESLGSETTDFLAAAEAIRTTDAYRKVTFNEIELDGTTYRIAGMCKGAGMIAPNMATFLSVFLTDAPLEADAVAAMLKKVVKLSFNRCSVDGHTSTNDTCLLLASGLGRPGAKKLSSAATEKFTEAMTETAINLAKCLVADGEGAIHYMALEVIGAANDDEAELVAKTVAASPLVKSALSGNDPNWGRIVSAAGYCDATIEPAVMSLKICGIEIYRDGTPLEFDAKTVSNAMKAQVEVPIELRIGRGSGKATYWASDLTVDYVKFNSEYTT